MSTIKTKESFTKIQNFLNKGGGDILVSKKTDNILEMYNKFLITIERKKETRLRKIYFCYLLCWYLKDQNKFLKNITRENVYNYFEECSKLNWGFFHQDNNKLNIRHFLNWTYQNNITKISGDMVLPKIVWHKRTNIRTYYTEDEITRLLNVIDIRTNRGKENYLIISIICYLGLRISDVVNLKLNDIDFNQNTISIIQEKTKEKLTLPLIDKVKYPLLDYIKNVRPTTNDLDYIFITREEPYEHNIRLKTHSDIVKNYMIKAGIDIKDRKKGFHSLRHSFSTLLLSENVDLYSISTILGHQAINTTMLYLDIDTSKLKELALEVPLC